MPHFLNHYRHGLNTDYLTGEYLTMWHSIGLVCTQMAHTPHGFCSIFFQPGQLYDLYISHWPVVYYSTSGPEQQSYGWASFILKDPTLQGGTYQLEIISAPSERVW